MEIPNLAKEPTVVKTSAPLFSPVILIIILVAAVTSGFWLSRVAPQNGSISVPSLKSDNTALSTDTISSASQLEVGKVYGNTEKAFKDTAEGTIEKGSINGEGTHILNRAGGATQRASLTSSAVDLDLFVGKKVQVKGETNASTKTSWLLDVGSIKILE